MGWTAVFTPQRSIDLAKMGKTSKNDAKSVEKFLKKLF